MERIWLKNYPDNVPADIDPDVFSSIVDLFEYSAKKYRKQPALYNMGSTLKYGQLDKKTKYFAAYLQHHLQLKKGDRIAIMLPNSMQYFVAMIGALRAGLTVVNVNPMYTPRELEHQVNDAKVDTIVVLVNFVHTLEQALPTTGLKNIIIYNVLI